MSGGFPAFPELCCGSDVGTSTAASRGTSVSVGNNTVGAWTQLTASSPVDAAWMLVMIEPPNGSADVCAVDIGVGGSGSELVVAQQLMSSGATATEGGHHYLIPCSLPSGTRIAARGQGSASDTCYVSIVLFDAGFMGEGCAGVDAIGFQSGTTVGSSITPSTTANTKGSYTQLIAATGVDYDGLYLSYNNLKASVTNAYYLLDLAIGASGSELIIIPNIVLTPGGFITTPNTTGPFWINLPAGTRIAARCQASSASSTAFGLMLYGIYK